MTRTLKEWVERRVVVVRSKKKRMMRIRIEAVTSELAILGILLLMKKTLVV